MSNEEFNTLEDLVFSHSFRNWVLKGETPEAEFWTNWTARNPDKAAIVNHAKAIIYALQLNLRPLSADTVDAEVARVLQKLRDGRLNPVREIPLRPGLLGRRPARGWTIAAAIAGICIIAWSLRFYLHHRQEDLYHSFVAGSPAKPIRFQTADTGGARLLTLPDGSTVRLTHGGKLFFPDGLVTASHHREVYLEGQAFFDIAHNPSLPFYVYTHSVITKVLGTSFTINTGAAGKKTIVSVVTGKVSVYRKTDLSDGVILTPNQQITWNPDDGRIDKSLADQPRQLAGATDTTLTFNATPISTVFRRLQNCYGIPILYDENAVAGCSLSVTMGNEPFYEKLNIICKAIDASYESIDGNIVITAKGCK